ncbi:MAG: hypothetical protein BVN30_12830 [Proteobacteria bacterium ST_bin16]|nr:MAG: hypothetical protein BVN30_12830 [Proteobacteria bacterium ST_bin16]
MSFMLMRFQYFGNLALSFFIKGTCLFLIFTITGCVSNEPIRKGGIGSPCINDECKPPVELPFIEKHDQYDLAFVEFTERGNVFDRQRLEDVLEYIDKKGKSDEGAIVIVFAHGWKNNAKINNNNVENFRGLLSVTAKLEKQWGSKKKVVGVYIGWRGQTLDVEFLNNITYWDRKAVAEQVGKGGVTELLLRLEHMLDSNSDKNLYLVTGHSFGGAIILSALHEVMLERVISAKETYQGCYKTRPFGHGVILLNPAIEANEALQLKELVAQKCFDDTQTRLMHIISSNADIATKLAFPIGQLLGVNLRWSQAKILREFQPNKIIELYESELDTTTVGNSPLFRTGQFDFEKGEYRTCVGGKSDCVRDQEEIHIPVKKNEPLAFIYTDSAFINGHNDVFNSRVQAYIAAIVTETRAKRNLVLVNENKCFPSDKNDQRMQSNKIPSECFLQINGIENDFDFKECFNFFQRKLNFSEETKRDQ